MATLTARIARTIDLAAEMDDPAPILRRVKDLEHQRAELAEGLERLRAQREEATYAATADVNETRALLRRLFAQIQEQSQEAESRAAARLSLQSMLERIELDPLTPAVRLHYAVQTGDKMASPRGFEPLLQP